MRLHHLWLSDFRNYRTAELDPDPEGLTVIRGANGQGKTNLLEAIGYLATLGSFRGAPREALIRHGTVGAVVRAEGTRQDRRLLLEAEIPVVGRDRYLLNRQPLRRGRDLLGALRVTVFSPEDLGLVQGGPAGRRDLLDEALVAVHPKNEALRSETERILRQRGALLRQAEGRLTPEVESTLDVWDLKLNELGSRLAEQREDLVAALEPLAAAAYAGLAAGPDTVGLTYRRSWSGPLDEALRAVRKEDLRRAVSTIGPHRDELEINRAGLPARTHASQGEQRGVALALRLGLHALTRERTGSAPVLLLDDVFSELDPARSTALLGLLPPGQALLTTAGPLPEAARPELVVSVGAGALSAP